MLSHHLVAVSLVCLASASDYPTMMLEDGVMVEAAPVCEDSWLHHNSSCYWFSSTRLVCSNVP